MTLVLKKSRLLIMISVGIGFIFGGGCHWTSPTLSRLSQGDAQQPVYEDPATHFLATGELGGGCGIHPDLIESAHFVALNVQNTPGDYSSWLPRPNQDQKNKGMWDNGRNCGRWVRVVLSDDCADGSVSGRKDEPKCERYQSDDYNGATADFVVTDSCQDDNRWCRDYPFHLDLSTASLKNFVKDGKSIGDLTGSWRNRKVKWSFIESPQNKPVEIHFIRNAQLQWATIGITHLKNGLHGVLYQDSEGKWIQGKMNGDNGQTYQISPKDAQGNFSIKIVDANDREDPKIYDFKFPCQKICSAPYTKVSYSVSGADGDNAPSTQAPTPRDIIQTPPTPPSPQEPQVPSEPRQSAPSQPRPTPELPHEGTNQNGTNDNILSIVYKQQSQWDNGYCVEVEASHSQQKTTKNWSAQFRLPWGNLQNFWNLEITALETGRFKIKPTESWAQTIGPGQRVGGMGFCINGATMGEGTPETNLINVDF